MTRKIYSLLTSIFCLFLLTTTTAQDGGDRRGDLKFNAQPKHMWEVGLHGGHFMVIGDVLPRPSFGAGFHVRRALDYAWSLRLDAMYGRAIGLEPRNSGNSATGPTAANQVLRDLGYDQNDWYHNFKTDFWGIDLQGVFSLNSFNFKNQTRKLNWYVLGGPGVNVFRAWYDATDDNGNIHDFSNVGNGLSPGTSRDDRKEATSRVKDILDGNYETRAETASGRRSGNGSGEDERQMNLHATVGAGVAYRINERFNIAIEHQTKVVFGNEGDLLDGYRHRSTFDLTQYRDMINYTNIRLNVNLGNPEKASEPLWWVSPMDLLAEDIAEVKARPKVDMTDTDGDGVIDMIDQEKNSDPGCPVDTRGIILDSDKDGVVDCKDKEPYTPAGFVQSVDADGVAAMPTPNYTTEDDVNRIVDSKLANAATKNPTVVNGGMGDWFLPMIHFDFNRYNLKSSAYGPLHHVATVMKQNPNIKVLVEGHTDRTSDNCYNDVLSFNRAKTAIDYLTTKYGISRNRLVLRWGGEQTNLVPTEAKNMMNRRVEFKVANGETDMKKPDCRKDAGVGGTNFSGNKEAGY